MLLDSFVQGARRNHSGLLQAEGYYRDYAEAVQAGRSECFPD